MTRLSNNANLPLGSAWSRATLAGYVPITPTTGTTPLHEFVRAGQKPAIVDIIYTSTQNEIDTLQGRGYTANGVIANVYTAPIEL
ncbi:hypothetical protein [Streptomyces sp. NBC_01264]|uniref:hypothetical protein n=1 Tax=Streptomyces sp. NBC_01264 TaxID=2903804 RepID=UPI00224EA1B0|nr:hypothetical protein [Streptomyces sp. NBC_01264]MCX4775451.1 hypothetical protein [Streptomyces sp. NBC_01264]